MYSHEIELGKHTLIRKGMERKDFLNDEKFDSGELVVVHMGF